MNEYELIEEAMRGVRVVPCPPCQGVGETLEGPCRDCEATGALVINELEVGHES